jgi:GNAT superfamily N-acetyltransferase
VIERALGTWAPPERIRRLSLPLYRYSAVDLQHLTVWVAQQSGEIVGRAAWGPADPADAPRGRSTLPFSRPLRVPRAHGQGIARSLLEAALSACRADGSDGVLVKAQAQAVGFFDACGLERAVLRKPLIVALAGNLIAVFFAVASHLFPPVALDSDVTTHIQFVDTLVIATGVTHWTAVVTAAVVCFVVAVMKGPACIAARYGLVDSDRTHSAEGRLGRVRRIWSGLMLGPTGEERMANDVLTWPELAAALYDKLTGRGPRSPTSSTNSKFTSRRTTPRMPRWRAGC